MTHTAELIAVGTELLLGNIANLDAQILSQGLSELGLNVFWHTVVGDNPQRAREAVELARKVGVRRETIVRLEVAKYNPSLKLAMDIAKVFHVSVEELFEFVDNE